MKQKVVWPLNLQYQVWEISEKCTHPFGKILCGTICVFAKLRFSSSENIYLEKKKKLEVFISMQSFPSACPKCGLCSFWPIGDSTGSAATQQPGYSQVRLLERLCWAWKQSLSCWLFKYSMHLCPQCSAPVITLLGRSSKASSAQTCLCWSDVINDVWTKTFHRSEEPDFTAKDLLIIIFI